MLLSPLLVERKEFLKWALADQDISNCIGNYVVDELGSENICTISASTVWDFITEVPVSLVRGSEEMVSYIGADGFVPTSECILVCSG
jgi:hypothetical protein